MIEGDVHEPQTQCKTLFREEVRMRYILLAAILVFTSGCTQDNDARRALSAQGFDRVELTGYRFYGCGQHDVFHTGFRAWGQNRPPVTGVVCAGLWKGSTIRYD